MGFFSNNTATVFPWLELNSIAQLEEIWNSTNNQTCLIFKHSTRCGISSMVKNQFEKKWNLENKTCVLYYLDLLIYREISSQIESLMAVQHQSPQVIVFQNKHVIYHESHNGIDVNNIEQALQS
ncbi:MAG: bacillithiol system redox-active protein YtxJ [Flavobacteriia bacterium]|nr:bacillithiol system redox-active protein YtxJ [Flavobacteriia bacterium]